MCHQLTACCLFVENMHSCQHMSVLVVIVAVAQFVPVGTKHITVTLDAKWKSTPLLLETW